MKKILYSSLILFLNAFSSFVYSQISIPLLHNELKCIPCKEVENEDKNKIKSVVSLLKNDEMQALEKLLELSQEESFSKNGRILCLLEIIDYYTIEKIEENDIIYNLALSEFGYENNYEISETEAHERTVLGKKGATEICNLYDKAIALSLDSLTTKYLQNRRLDYLINSNFMDEIYDYDFIKSGKIDDYFDFESITEINHKAINEGIDNRFYEQVLTDYNTTHFLPYQSYLGLNLGLTSNYGNNFWVGGEISLDAVGHKNPFQFVHPISRAPNFRSSSMGISFMKNSNSNSYDLGFFPSRITNLFFVNLNILQFGFQWGEQFGDNSKYWYYRPEIGFSYAIFSLSYSYNLLFDKFARNLTDKSMVTFKISYPLLELVKM
jgi:hypothetical protein